MALRDDDLRVMVRDSIARLQRSASGERVVPVLYEPQGVHASHGRFVLASGSDGDGACLIEPAVRCNHCGYCQSYGH